MPRKGSRVEKSEKMERSFWQFHHANPHVFTRFLEICLQLRRRGFRRYSAYAILRFLRFEEDLRTGGSEIVVDGGEERIVKLNDHHTPYYVRFMLKEQPKLEGFFETRRAAADFTSFDDNTDGSNGKNNQMKQILIASPLTFERLETDAWKFLMTALTGEQIKFVRAQDLDWQTLRVNEGGYQGAHAWIARTYDVLIACLHPETGGMTRGVYDMAQRMLATFNKKVAAWDGTTIRPVVALERGPKEEHKTNYGVVTYG